MNTKLEMGCCSSKNDVTESIQASFPDNSHTIKTFIQIDSKHTETLGISPTPPSISLDSPYEQGLSQIKSDGAIENQLRDASAATTSTDLSSQEYSSDTRNHYKGHNSPTLVSSASIEAMSMEDTSKQDSVNLKNSKVIARGQALVSSKNITIPGEENTIEGQDLQQYDICSIPSIPSLDDKSRNHSELSQPEVKPNSVPMSSWISTLMKTLTAQAGYELMDDDSALSIPSTVSYTHLTLPTKA